VNRLALTIAVALTACPSPGHQELPPTRPTSSIPEACLNACSTLRRMHCVGEHGSPGQDELYGTADDVSCERVCADLEAAAKEVPAYSLHPGCISAASSCSAVAACAR
jgi:hypothetical protein